MSTRLRIGLGLYAAIALAAGLTLDGKLRALIWILTGALAFKSWLGEQQSK